MTRSIEIARTRYKVGDRIWYMNEYNQAFYGTIKEVVPGMAGARPCLLVMRDDWGLFGNPECINPEDYVRTRHFPQGE